jgi:hypothetical protein
MNVWSNVINTTNIYTLRKALRHLIVECSIFVSGAGFQIVNVLDEYSAKRILNSEMWKYVIE